MPIGSPSIVVGRISTLKKAAKGHFTPPFKTASIVVQSSLPGNGNPPRAARTIPGKARAVNMHQSPVPKRSGSLSYARLRTDDPAPLGEVADAKTRATVPRAVQVHEAPYTHSVD